MSTQNLRPGSLSCGIKLAMIGLLAAVMFTNCKKQISLTSNSGDVSAKVNAWLDKNKTNGIKINKDANIELLKQNLDFNAATTESRDSHNDFLIIPIKDGLIEKKNLHRNATLNLLLVTDKAGKIRSGNIVEYLPDDQKKLSALPGNTFHNMFNGRPVNEDGMFRFLSVTERWMFQLSFKNKKLVSNGIIQTNNTKKTDADGCTDWYLVTTFYFADGSSDQTSAYIGTTCENGCDDPMAEGLCPDGGGGGGGGSSDSEVVTDDVTYSDNETDFTEEDLSDGQYVPIAYNYHATIIRDAQTDEIESVEVYPVTASPTWSIYVDMYGRNVTRSLTLFGQANYYTQLSPTSVMLNWNCLVNGRYTYTDGSPAWTRQWSKSRSEVR